MMLPCASTTTSAVLPAGVDAELAVRRLTRLARSPSPSPGPDPIRPLLAATPCSRCATAIPPSGNCTFGPISGNSRVCGRAIFGSSPPPSRYTRFGLSAKMPRAPPYVHFSWPGSVLRSCGHPSTTSYGPETSCAPMASGTAENAVPGAAAAGAAADGMSRPPSGMPAARPTTSANATAAVLLMPSLCAWTCGAVRSISAGRPPWQCRPSRRLPPAPDRRARRSVQRHRWFPHRC